jgi:lysozyme
VLFSFVLIKPFNFALETAWRALQLPNLDSTQSMATLNSNEDADFVKPIQKGDVILGYTVTSGFGLRVAPISGASTNHSGVDLATPEGTPLYVIGSVENKDGFTGYGDVFCDNNLFGANKEGTAAYVKVPNYPGVEFVYWHLKPNTCASGKLAVGSKFAETGNSGNSEGAHLHFGVRVVGDWVKLNFKSEWQHPTTGVLRWSLEGKKPERTAITTVPSDLKPLLDTIRYAEGTDKEDGYKTIFSGAKFDDFSKHPDKVYSTIFDGKTLASAAAGAYQYMPDTWNRVSKAINAIDFSPANQDRGAIFLIKERGALELAKQGQIKQSIFKLCKEWASLPCHENDTKGAYDQAVKPIGELMAVYEKKKSGKKQ